MRLLYFLAFALLGQCLSATPLLSLNDLIGTDERASTAAIISDSDSDSSSSDDDSGEEFVENVADWRPAAVCPQAQFRSTGGQCRQCTICGPDSYERQSCQLQRDTRCEWCLSDSATPGQGDYNAKCSQLVQLRNEFRRVMARQQRKGSQGMSPTLHFSSIQLDASSWSKAELAVEMAFYLALIALVVAVIRFLCKTRASSAYRTVQISPPPPPMDDLDQKNIVRAAESIRQKLGKKGYDRLEEEFI